MEPVPEDNVKEVGWREMPLFNGRQWLIAIGLYTFIFISLIFMFVPIMVTGKMTAQEQELAEKKKDLERKLAYDSDEKTNQQWLIATVVKIKDVMTEKQRKSLLNSKIQCKFYVNSTGAVDSIKLINRSSDEQKNALALKIVETAAPFPVPLIVSQNKRTLFLTFNKAPEIEIYRNE